jgi:hypothetical protein
MAWLAAAGVRSAAIIHPLLQTNDKLEVGSVVEHRGRLIEIDAEDATPYRGVITPLRGHLR